VLASLVAALVYVAPHPAPDARVVPPATVGLSAQQLARVGAYLDEQISRGRLPGAVVLVARRGKIAYFESFGFQDVATRKPLRKDAIFRVQSLTKPWVSVAAMSLLEEGKLLLRDPVSKWFPAFRKMQVIAPRDASGGVAAIAAGASPALATIPARREITIYDLLRHTSGFTYGLWASDPAVKDAYVHAGLGTVPGNDLRTLAPEQFVERLASVPLVHEPGTVYEYGLSTDLLGLVIEAIEGARLGTVLERRVFGPLGMTDSGFFVPGGKLDRVAQPLANEPGTGKPVEALDVSVEPRMHAGGHGGVSTALDYFRFCEMLRLGGRAGQARVLGRATVEFLSADHLTGLVSVAPGSVPPGYSWGLASMVRGSAGAGLVPGSPGELYWGGAPSGTAFWIDPREQLVVVFMAQATWADHGVYRSAVRQIVQAAIAD
jgi:CubicO group peptidase (beta-lactamase class C family)